MNDVMRVQVIYRTDQLHTHIPNLILGVKLRPYLPTLQYLNDG